MNEEEYDLVDVEETPHRRFSPLAITSMFIGLLLVVGLGIYFAVHYYHQVQENNKITVEKVEKQLSPKEMNYADYERYFKDHGIKKPLDSFIENVKISDEGRVKVDPLYNDPYIGYAENQTIHAALWKIEDGNLFFLYKPDTFEIVSIAEWADDYQLGLEIEKIRGEKAVLTADTLKETNYRIQEENKQKIKGLNEQLLNLVSKVNAQLNQE